MPAFLISYDLHNRRVYTDLLASLKGWQAVRLHKSLWLANLKGPASVIRDLLKTDIDNDDSIAVIEIPPGSDWATLRVEPGSAEFLSRCVTVAEVKS